jgi:hypothetical protein
MAFKGNIPKGSQVDAELSVNNSAHGSALLSIGFADNAGGSAAESATIAPGATDHKSVQTNPQPTGIMRIVVDFNSDTDSGRLVVRVNGVIRDDENITGDTPWSYSLA